MDARLEERYIVIKRSHITDYVEARLREFIEEHGIGTVDCVVIEEDWPEYDPTVNLLWERINGV